MSYKVEICLFKNKKKFIYFILKKNLHKSRQKLDSSHLSCWVFVFFNLCLYSSWFFFFFCPPSHKPCWQKTWRIFFLKNYIFPLPPAGHGQVQQTSVFDSHFILWRRLMGGKEYWSCIYTFWRGQQYMSASASKKRRVWRKKHQEMKRGRARGRLLKSSANRPLKRW